MLPSIADIKEKISKSGISQRKICRDLQLDVTWLNKLVKKKPEDSNPSYKKIKMILDYLERKVSTKTTKKAGEICAHPLITVKVGMTLSEIRKKLQKKAFTQAPVTYRDHIIGVITVNKIYELLDTPNFDKNTALGKKYVIQVLTIPYDHPIGNLGKTLLSTNEPCVLDEKDGKKYGIITIEDIMMSL